MEEIPPTTNNEEENNNQKEVKIQNITLLWILQYAVAGIAYSVTSFFTTLSLKKWWKNHD